MRLPQESLDRIAKVIFNKVKGVKTPISGNFGEGDIVITKVRCENFGTSNCFSGVRTPVRGAATGL